MGHLNEQVGRITVEERATGIKIHWDYDEAEQGEEKLAEQWARYPHPEIPYADLPDLIKALTIIRR